MFAFIGGGGGYPGVVSIGQGQIALENAYVTGPNGVVSIRPGEIQINRFTDIHVFLQVQLSAGSSGAEFLLQDALGATMMEIDADGSVMLAAGIGTHNVPAQAVPRTLAQATITAITDTNAKASAQALANALSDIGALTIT